MLTPMNNTLQTNINFSGRINSPKIIRHVSFPEYGIDYHKGDLLFTQDKCPKANAIYYFTRWDRKSGIKVAHVAIITDESSCIEVIKGGHKKTDLKKYFYNEKFRIFIRKPQGMTEEIAHELVRNEENRLGKTKYAYGLISISVLRGTLVGHLIDKATNNEFFDSLALLVNKNGLKAVLCNQDAGYYLRMFEKMRKKWTLFNEDALKRPFGTNPQKLFETDKLFEPTVVQIR